jgi:hypothetical protein
VKRNLPLAQASSEEAVLSTRVQEALGQLVSSAKEGLLALSVGVGLGVLAELLEEEVVDVVGPKGKHDPERSALRHGHEPGEVTLGGRRVAVRRPRVRSADGSAEVRLQTYEHFASRDAFARVVMERMLASVSARRYARGRAGRLGGRGEGAVDLEAGGVADVHRADATLARRADEPAPGRRAPGGDDDRRARAAGTH